MKLKYLAIILAFMLPGFAQAQKAERDLLRKGNRAFRDSVYDDAETMYRKALEINPNSTKAMYNIGDALQGKGNKDQEALEQYAATVKIEKDKAALAKSYHNMGTIFHKQKDYAKAVEAYKEALRNNPKDDETRYNLALAQKMLKDQEQNQDEKENQQQQQKEQDNQQQQSQDQQQDQPQQDQQNNDKEQMSKENAEQLLNAVMQDEKNTQDRRKKQQQAIQGGKLEKDW